MTKGEEIEWRRVRRSLPKSLGIKTSRSLADYLD